MYLFGGVERGIDILKKWQLCNKNLPIPGGAITDRFLVLTPTACGSLQDLEHGLHSDQLDTTQSKAHGTTQNSSTGGLFKAWHFDSSKISYTVFISIKIHISIKKSSMKC